jgi:23S rRNA (cytidine1920-2'-O)/16S rRNA (cytidine1409-2'-O)-methyltransferase
MSAAADSFPAKKKERVDKLILARGLAPSREKAQALIMAGLVYSGDHRVKKAGEMLGIEDSISLVEVPLYVSRAGMKLAEALQAYDLSVTGKIAADLGSSTGGFTDCLLQKGARLVYAVDVSISQLDWRLRNDPRVIPIEKNARYLEAGDFAEKPDIVTMDLSFISVLKVLPALKRFLADGIILGLIKPQFEAGKGEVGRRGIVREPGTHESILNDVLEKARELGFGARGLIGCSVRGQRGNREFLVYWTLRGRALSPEKIRELVREVVYEE